MKTTMIEIEYKREGKAEILTDDEWYPQPTGRFVHLTGYVRRTRRRPHSINRLLKVLAKPYIMKAHEPGNESWGTDCYLKFPPATIIRQRTITIERGEWEAVNSDPAAK